MNYQNKMEQEQLINRTITFVKETLKEVESGHDWFHIERVYNNALLIAKEEKVDLFVVKLGALLHDIADAKFHEGNETLGPKKARAFLEKELVDETIIRHVENIINHISYKNSLENTAEKFTSNELKVVQDADRLDAIGAIGIARCFNYGGFKNRPIYDPEIKPNLNLSKEAYKNSTAPTINHFYEKLLRLKDQMNTKTGQKIALSRHEFMTTYLHQFFEEWSGKK